jgi:hypothetical protein
MIKKSVILLFVLLSAMSSCQKLDVVGNGSIKSFEKILDAMQDKVALIEEGWWLAAPDNSARFMWSNYCVYLEFEAKPFLDAGLDISGFPYNMFEDKIMIYEELFLETPIMGDTPLDSYKEIVKLRRDMIGYHASLDHYGISIGGGNMFEWAKDMSKNDKDIVFVLNPQPFIDAGVDPNKIEGWLFAKVTVDDENGRPIQADKLLKPFNLR